MTLQKDNGRPIIDRKPKWYVIYVKSRYEHKVSDRLNELGVKNYLPQQKVLKKWSDRKKWVLEPLFKSYLFVYMGLGKYTRTIDTEGVVAFVCFGGLPEAVPYQQIQLIRKMLDADMEIEVSDKKFEAGDKVKVVKGPLSDFIGDYTEKRGKHKVIVRMDMIGQSILVTIPLAHLEKV